MLTAVKTAIILAAVVFTVAYLLNDYAVVRQRALNGQQAFEFIQKQLAAQQTPAAPKVTPAP